MLSCRGKCLQVFVDIKLLAFTLILHDKPGMFQGDYLSEKAIFGVQLTQELLILARAETEADIGFEAKADQLLQAFNHKSINGVDQVFAVVVIIVCFLAVLIYGSKT